MHAEDDFSAGKRLHWSENSGAFMEGSEESIRHCLLSLALHQTPRTAAHHGEEDTLLIARLLPVEKKRPGHHC